MQLRRTRKGSIKLVMFGGWHQRHVVFRLQRCHENLFHRREQRALIRIEIIIIPTLSHKPADVASNERNEYIPSFISKKPFYVDDDSGNYVRGKRAQRRSARWTGKNIEADEVLQTVDLGWDAKRDRRNGYDASEYGQVVDEYEELESMKRAAKEGADPKKLMDGNDGNEGLKEDIRCAEESDPCRQQSTATSNPRTRKDTAKYLLPSFLIPRNTIRRLGDDGYGDAAEVEKAQQYAWDSQEKGMAQVHLQGDPTSGEVLRKKEKEEIDTKREAHREAPLEEIWRQ
ncbi:Pre-mRNA-splicing factor slu7 [Penicillium atrosanguineum]|uniref:Pre-mRNA-splicing factor SLU7 n=1 Tax=Penicillium atrosanguineum TaxID=1132637 RepID=A0A9W9Q262_9EURO|nr:Pre-mRNA-splicing factor slu7 [Penicillium atrosanguineum]